MLRSADFTTAIFAPFPKISVRRSLSTNYLRISHPVDLNKTVIRTDTTAYSTYGAGCMRQQGARPLQIDCKWTPNMGEACPSSASKTKSADSLKKGDEIPGGNDKFMPVELNACR